MEINEKSNQQEEETGGYNVETYEPINLKPEEARQNKECIIKAFTEPSTSQNDNNMNYQNISNYIYTNYNNMNYQINNSQILYNDQNNTNYSVSYPLVQSGVENINYYQNINPTNNQNSYYYQDMNSSNYNYPVSINYNYGNNYNISEYSYQYIPQTVYGYNNSNYYGSPYRQSFLITQNNIYPTNYGRGFNYTNVYL